MDLRQLRYFVAVAEELHFSRAAARLHLAQSALSAQIRQLEGEIGGPLLNRSTRRVQLTPTGESLLADARDLLAAADEALSRAKALARGEAGALVIGALGPAPGGLLAPLLERFSSRHPDVRVEIRALAFSDLVDGVQDHYTDCAFVHLPIDDARLAVTPLLSEQRVVALAHDHPLARRPSLRPTDLIGQCFVAQPEAVPEAWRHFWQLVEDFGEIPAVSPQVADRLEDWLMLIGQGAGIDTAPSVIARYYARPEVAFVPLVDAAPATLAIIRPQDVDDPLVDDFCDLAVDMAKVAARSASSFFGPVP